MCVGVDGWMDGWMDGWIKVVYERAGQNDR